MPILYTDGNSTDAGASTSQQRDDRSAKMKHSKKERHRPLRQSKDGASLNTQSLPPSTRPTVLECNQMQEIKIGKWSVSKNTTLSDFRTASVAAAEIADQEELEARSLRMARCR
ncbi:hypothetical protein MRX96_006494 [Rhipicephalus microplus]